MLIILLRYNLYRHQIILFIVIHLILLNFPLNIFYIHHYNKYIIFMWFLFLFQFILGNA